MQHSINQSSPAREWKDLSIAQTPSIDNLSNIKTHLDLIIIALESLAGISSEAMLQAAKKLNLDSVIADRVTLWRLRQSNPQRKSSGGRKKLDVEEARSLVLIVCYLAKQHQELIRRACLLLEQTIQQNQPPHRSGLLGDYLDAFSNTYQERMEEAEPLSTDILYQLALKLLIDLIFYSSAQGHRRLWLALLDYSK
ncbi:MAG: DUF3038 domain-containing protein [Prochloraceae cyanobacterium]